MVCFVPTTRDLSQRMCRESGSQRCYIAIDGGRHDVSQFGILEFAALASYNIGPSPLDSAVVGHR